MFFWFKKKEIILDCFTASSVAYDYAKPDFAYKYFPEWFTRLPQKVSVRGVEGISIKSCRAVKRFYCANTIVISAPYHLAIDAAPVDKKSFNWVTASLDEFITEHPPEQYQGFLDDSYQHIKLSNPWALKTNKFVEFIWTDPTWSRSNLFDYSVLPGVVDYRYQQDAHINLFFQYLKEPRKIEIALGTPLVLLAPLSECNIKIKHHLVSKAEMSRFAFRSGLNGQKRYSQNKQIIEAAEKRDAIKKCPFHLRW